MPAHLNIPALETLRAAGIAYEVACYPANAEPTQAAHGIGLASDSIFKTLALATMNRAGIVLACLPA